MLELDKIESNPGAMTGLSATATFVAFAMTLGVTGNMGAGGIAALLTAAACGWIAASCYLRDAERQWQGGVIVIRSIKATFLTQQIVDAKLRERALEFEKACSAQIKLQGGDSAEADLGLIKDQIEKTKAAFWQAHALAKHQGYAVKLKIRDYTDEVQAA
jgi:hypothetical protein